MTYPELKGRAKQMRMDGYSYSLISEHLGVSKSTLSNWLSHIPYEPNAEVVNRIGYARAKAGEQKHKIKLASLHAATQFALNETGVVTERDLLMIGLGLYLGEGEKNLNVGIINSDPRVIQLAIRWLTKVWDLDIRNLTLAIHLYPDNNESACLQYWSDISGIPLSQFGKTQIDTRVNKRVGKRRKLPYGTAHLRVRSNGNKVFGVLLSRKIHAMIDIIANSRA